MAATTDTDASHTPQEYAVTNLPALTPAQPTVTTTSTVNSWTAHLGPVQATITYEYEPVNWSTVYVDSGLAESIDPQLAALAERERNLGDDRWLSRDIDPQVDDLYDQLNQRIAAIQTMIAVAVLPELGDILDVDCRLLDKVEFDAYAGCQDCKCSPGVKAPYARRDGVFVQIFVEPAA